MFDMQKPPDNLSFINDLTVLDDETAPKVVAAMKENTQDDDHQRHCCACLAKCAGKNGASQRAAAKAGCIQELVRSLNDLPGVPGVQEDGLKAICAIVQLNKENREAAGPAGCVEIAGKAMKIHAADVAVIAAAGDAIFACCKGSKENQQRAFKAKVPEDCVTALNAHKGEYDVQQKICVAIASILTEKEQHAAFAKIPGSLEAVSHASKPPADGRRRSVDAAHRLITAIEKQ